MKTFLRIAGGIVLALVVAIAGIVVGARFADGPLAMIAGGHFETGEVYAGPEPDWSFVRDLAEIELQTLEPARSRTTWVVFHDGRAFVPCGYMNSTLGRMWKQWPVEAERDGRAVVRIDGTLYERYLLRVIDNPTLMAIVAELLRKYAGQGAAELTSVPEGLWVFELAPRAQQAVR